MEYANSPYYSMEIIEEDGKFYVLFCNADCEPIARKELPKDSTIEACLAKMGKNLE